jgi:dTDP-4-amino-4,6-dideoxygalactose transaminase
VDKYTWVDVGSSYLPSEILAAVLYSHFEEADFIQNKRKSIWGTYRTNLQDWARENDVRLPFVPDYCEQSYHMFYMLLLI